MTARIIRAIEHPCTSHARASDGPVAAEAGSYAVNVAKVIDAALANRVAIEPTPTRTARHGLAHWRAVAGDADCSASSTPMRMSCGLGFCRAASMRPAKATDGSAGLKHAQLV